MRTTIKTPNAPAAIGPYAQANIVNGTIYVSGQIPIDPLTGELSENEIKAQTKQCIKNIEAILAAAGSDLQNVVKTTVFLSDMGNFAAMNEVYAEFFSGELLPSRATVEVSGLPKGALVEIEAIAY